MHREAEMGASPRGARWDKEMWSISKREFVISYQKMLLKFRWQPFYMSDFVTKELYYLNRELQNFRRVSPCLNAQHNEFVPTEHSPLTFQNLQHTKRETFVQISRILIAQVNRHCLLIFPLQWLLDNLFSHLFLTTAHEILQQFCPTS